MKYWHNVKTDPPYEGMAVMVLNMNGELDKDFWTADIAYYSNGEFYTLEVDPHLGVLRKTHYPDKVEFWAKPVEPDMSEVKTR